MLAYSANYLEEKTPLKTEPQDLVRETWAKAAAAHIDMSRLFYGRLFKIAPETKPLFKADMAQQGRKLVATLAFVIDHLSDNKTLVGAAQDLAVRHLNYNVEKHHYALVGEALLWTLEELLGAEYTPEVAKAWSDVYTSLETIMTDAAYSESA